jgi:hypothetical protein
VIRLRSIDTNPIQWPSRLLPQTTGSAERFAKCATVVTKLYSLHLDAGAPLVAKTSWARFIPTEMPGPASFSDVPMTADLGLGEVHEVPYDPAVLALPDAARRLAILNWLQDNLLQLARALGWAVGPLEAAYQACRRDNCELRQSGTPKASPDRRYRARVEFEIDGDGDGWSWVVVTDRAGAVVARGERRDSDATLTASGRVRRSLRWQDDQVTWIPWTSDIAPPDYKWWINHVARLSVSDG